MFCLIKVITVVCLESGNQCLRCVVAYAEINQPTNVYASPQPNFWLRFPWLYYVNMRVQKAMCKLIGGGELELAASLGLVLKSVDAQLRVAVELLSRRCENLGRWSVWCAVPPPKWPMLCRLGALNSTHSTRVMCCDLCQMSQWERFWLWQYTQSTVAVVNGNDAEIKASSSSRLFRKPRTAIPTLFHGISQPRSLQDLEWIYTHASGLVVACLRAAREVPNWRIAKFIRVWKSQIIDRC